MAETPSGSPAPAEGPSISRRQALMGALGVVSAGTALVAAGPALSAPGSVVVAGAGSPAAHPHRVFRRSRYTPHIGRVFALADPASARLRLVAIADISDGRGGVATDHQYAFALRFRQLSGPDLRQGTYTLLHPELGRTGLFMQPVGGRRMVAIINRLIVP